MSGFGVLLVVATASYVASILLGVLTASARRVAAGARWPHHALYVCTFVFAAAAVAVGAVVDPAAGWVLAPSLVAFAFIPFLGARGRRHPLVGSAPAPFYLAALIVAAIR